MKYLFFIFFGLFSVLGFSHEPISLQHKVVFSFKVALADIYHWKKVDFNLEKIEFAIRGLRFLNSLEQEEIRTLAKKIAAFYGVETGFYHLIHIFEEGTAQGWSEKKIFEEISALSQGQLHCVGLFLAPGDLYFQ